MTSHLCGEGAISLFNKGFTVILTSTTDEIPSDSQIFDNATKTPLISGYVDMLAAAGNDYGKAGKEAQAPATYETAFGAIQSNKNGVRRVKFQDTDDNSVDAQAVDYSANNVAAVFPRCVADGAWDEYTVLLNEIEAAKSRVPRFYAAYCTEESAAGVAAVLSALDEAVSAQAGEETLTELLGNLETAAAGLVFRSDEKVPQVYIATDKGNGESYGTTLTKKIGYVPAQITVIDAGGEMLASDSSWASEIKVRGNSTANGAKKPYNMKFNSKVDLFGMGSAKNGRYSLICMIRL